MTIKLKYITLCLALLGTISTQAQRIITGTVQDETAQSLPFAAVALMQDSIPMKTGQTETDGAFQQVLISNALGQVVLTADSSQINTSALSSGIYYVTVKTNTETMTQKFLKQ